MSEEKEKLMSLAAVRETIWKTLRIWLSYEYVEPLRSTKTSQTALGLKSLVLKRGIISIICDDIVIFNEILSIKMHQFFTLYNAINPTTINNIINAIHTFFWSFFILSLGKSGRTT